MRWVRDELEARSVVDAESELTALLGYRDGRTRNGERTGLVDGTGGGRERAVAMSWKGISRRGQGNPGREGASATVLGQGAMMPVRRHYS